MYGQCGVRRIIATRSLETLKVFWRSADTRCQKHPPPETVMYSLRLEEEAPKPSPLEGARLLVIAGSTRGAALAGQLAESGAEVVAVHTGREALTWHGRWAADAALVSLTLSEVDSLQLCEHLQAGPNAPALIGLADGATPQRQVSALQLGVDDIFEDALPEALQTQRLLNLLNRKRRERIYRDRITRLETYVPAAAVTRPAGPPERMHATLLFSDLRGFTAASFTQDAANVFDLINQILAAQIDRIQAAGGYVDGFSGDGLLALFEGIDGATRACAAASAILAWADRTAIPPFSHLPVGMGLHCGEVMRGDLGVPRRRVFTALGTPVNIAARLCGVARAGEAIVSQAIINTAGDHYNFTTPRAVRLKGIPQPFPVQTLIR